MKDTTTVEGKNLPSTEDSKNSPKTNDSRTSPVRGYEYQDANGNLLYVSARRAVYRVDSTGQYHLGLLDDTVRVLYHLPEITSTGADDNIYVTVGEDTADALRSLGVVATTHLRAPARGSWLDSYTDTIRQRSVLLLWTTPEEQSYATTVAKKIFGKVLTVKVIEIPAPSITAWINGGGDKTMLEALVHSVAAYVPAKTASVEITDLKILDVPGAALYEMRVEGKRLRVGSDAWSSPGRFAAAVFAVTHRYPKLPGGDLWIEFVNELMTNAEHVDVTDETDDDALDDRVRDLVMTLPTGSKRDDLVVGRAIERGGERWVHLDRLVARLGQTGPSVPRPRVQQSLHRLGGIDEQGRLDGKVTRYWRVPVQAQSKK